MRASVLFALASAIGLSACAATPIPNAVATLSQPDRPTVPTIASGYHVNPGDTIDILVFHQPDLSGTFQIGPSGSIALPLIGEVAVNGLTNSEISTLITKRLTERYLQDPQVSVSVKEAGSQHFTVDGAVTTPGVYTVIGDMTLLQAIATAHGAIDVSDFHRVVVFRVVDGKKVAGVFNVVKIRAGEAPDPRIYANDTIVVPVDNTAQALKNIVSTTPIAVFASVLTRF